MKTMLVLIMLGRLGWAGAHGAEHPLPAIPAAIAVPAGQHVAQVQTGRGTQNYVCQANADRTGFEWVLRAPQANIFEGSTKVAIHSAGPTWEALDGSKVVGAVQARVPSPDSIPWLLLSAKSVSGSGLYGKISFVQRLSTTGGVAPQAGCAAGTLGQEKKVAYSALYVFYEADGASADGY